MFTNLFFCTVKSVNPDIVFFVPGNSVWAFLISYMFLLHVVNIQHMKYSYNKYQFEKIYVPSVHCSVIVNSQDMEAT